MNLHLTLAYRANEGQAHPLDGFDNSIQKAMQDTVVVENLAENKVDAVHRGVVRVEAPVGNVEAIQTILFREQTRLRGLLMVDSSVDSALKAIPADHPLQQQPRFNIYKDVRNLFNSDEVNVPLMLQLAKKKDYTSICIVLRAIGDHADVAMAPTEEEEALAKRYVQGDMTGASLEHVQLSEVTNRDDRFLKDPDGAQKSLASHIRLLSFYIQKAKEAGFSAEQLLFVQRYEGIPPNDGKMLVVYDRHAAPRDEKITSHSVRLPFGVGSGGFFGAEDTQQAFLHQSFDSDVHALGAIKSIVTSPGRMGRWLETALPEE